jgi:hypothetical protein
MFEKIYLATQWLALWAIGLTLVGIGAIAVGVAVHAAWVPFLVAAAGVAIAWVGGILVIQASR